MPSHTIPETVYLPWALNQPALARRMVAFLPLKVVKIRYVVMYGRHAF